MENERVGVAPNGDVLYLFSGKEHPLSNFYPSPFTLDESDMGLGSGPQTYSTAEQYFQWRKAVLFGDEQTAAAILATDDPGIAKSLGRQVTVTFPSVT